MSEVANNSFAPDILDFKEVKGDALKAKVSLQHHLLVMEQFHNLLVLMAYHLPYMLKSQLVNILTYHDNKPKSQAYGYKKVKELEEALLIGIEKYNGAEYLFLTYRSYNYLGIDRSNNPVERKPGEAVLLRHFMRAEMYLRKANHTFVQQQNTFYRYYDKFSLVEQFKKLKINKYPEDFYYNLGLYFNEIDPNNWLTYKSIGLSELLEICPNPSKLDLMASDVQMRFLVGFIEKVLAHLSKRCSIQIHFDINNTMNVHVDVIHLSLSGSRRGYQTLFVDIERFLNVLRHLSKDMLLFTIDIHCIDRDEAVEFGRMVNPILKNREFIKMTPGVMDFHNLQIPNRFRKIEGYEGRATKSRMIKEV